MTETVVRVSTIEEWKAVLDVWFEQGYEWRAGSKEYHEDYFDSGSRGLWVTDDNMISMANTAMHDCIEYANFMAQQKEGNKMETYYVTREQDDFIDKVYGDPYPLDELLNQHDEAKKLLGDFSMAEGSALLRYLGDDETIKFKVEEQLYRLWRINNANNKVYMKFNLGTPDWTFYEEYAFTASLEEIKKHKTISWEIEEVK